MLFPKDLKNLYSRAEDFCREKEFIAGKSGRHMVFPYTITAKIAQFPFFFYLKNNWIWMYYPLGIAVGLFFFNKCNNLANSDSNKRNWAAQQIKNAEKEQHH